MGLSKKEFIVVTSDNYASRVCVSVDGASMPCARFRTVKDAKRWARKISSKSHEFMAVEVDGPFVKVL